MNKRKLFLIFGIGIVFLVFELAIFGFYLWQDDSSTQKSAQGVSSIQVPDALTQEEKIIREELDKITDPEFDAPLTKFILINDIEIEDGKVTIEINLPPWCPYKEKIIALIKEQISKVKDVISVEVVLKELKERPPKEEKEIAAQSSKKERKAIFNSQSEFFEKSKNYRSDPLVPKITDVSVRPTDVQPGDIMIVTASVSDNFGISSVTADMGGIETINLSLVDGSVYQGVWKNKWKVHDTEIKGYITTIVATNNLDLSSFFNIRWTDSADWWDVNYSHRKQITITNNTASTISAGYTVWITEDTASLVTDSNMQADGDDLRIVYWNGSSNVQLDRHLRYMNTATTEVYFKTQADIAGSGTDSNCYMYYYYSGATNPPANGANVYEFWEPFDSLTAWTTLTGTPSVSGGIVTLSPNCEIHHDMGYLGNVYNKVFEIFAKFDVSTATKSWIGVQMRTPNTGDPCGNQCCDNTYNGYRDLILIDSVVNGTAQTTVTAAATPGTGDDTRSSAYDPGTDYHVYTAKWKSGEVKYLHDRTAWATHAVDVSTGSYNVFLQLWAYANNALNADWYAVRKYVDPEPTTSLGEKALVYNYRKQITITNNTASTLSAGYTVWITEDTDALVTANKMQADGDDLRIFYWNGTNFVELDRHLRYMNTATTEVYFKTQADIAGSGTDSNYYMYYDCSAAANPPANGANVYEFWEPFDSLTAWTTLTGTPSVSGGIVTLSPNCEIHHDMGYLGNVYNKVFEIFAKFNVSTATKSWIGVQMKTPSTGNYCGNQCCDSTYDGTRDLILIDSVVNGTAQTTVTAAATPGTGDDTRSSAYNPGTDYHVYTAKWKSGEVKYLHDRTAWATHAVDVSTGSYNVFLQLWAYANNALNADWYAVRKYVDPEPTTSLGPPTLIELSYFKATPLDSAVLLEWKTETELDNEGFNILRSEEEKGVYVQINPFLIYSRGEGGLGAEYSYTDNCVINGITYYYLLEDIDFYGKRSTSGPVSATPNDIVLIWPVEGEPVSADSCVFSWRSMSYSSFKVDLSFNDAFPGSDALSFPKAGWTSNQYLWFQPEDLERLFSMSQVRESQLFWRVRARGEDGHIVCSDSNELVFEKFPSPKSIQKREQNIKQRTRLRKK